jgi:hypothetical protein
MEGTASGAPERGKAVAARGESSWQSAPLLGAGRLRAEAPTEQEDHFPTIGRGLMVEIGMRTMLARKILLLTNTKRTGSHPERKV